MRRLVQPSIVLFLLLFHSPLRAEISQADQGATDREFEQIFEDLLIEVFTRPYEVTKIIALVELEVPFDTGLWTIYRGFGTCVPKDYCSVIVAKDDTGFMMYLTLVSDLVRTFPPKTKEEAANISGFALQNSDDFHDLDCAWPIQNLETYQVAGSKKQVPLEPVSVHRRSTSFVVRLVEACRGTPDRLVRVEQVFHPEGDWEHKELEILAQGGLLTSVE